MMNIFTWLPGTVIPAQRDDSQSSPALWPGSQFQHWHDDDHDGDDIEDNDDDDDDGDDSDNDDDDDDWWWW